MNQNSAKILQTTIFCYSNAKSTLKLLLTFNKVEKTKPENSILFLFFFFLFSSSSPGINGKVYGVSKYLTYQTIAVLTCYIPICFELCVSYKWWVMAQMLSISCLRSHAYAFWLSHNNCVRVACIVRLHLDYWVYAVQAAMSLLGTNSV